MDTIGEAEEREAKKQLVTVNGRGDGREAGFNWQQFERQSQDREGWRDFLKDLCPSPPPPHGVKGFKLRE